MMIEFKVTPAEARHLEAGLKPETGTVQFSGRKARLTASDFEQVLYELVSYFCNLATYEPCELDAFGEPERGAYLQSQYNRIEASLTKKITYAL